MVRIRKGISYRRLERPYNWVSMFKSKTFIKNVYNTRLTRFVMGNLQKEDFGYSILLQPRRALQIRDNAIESARLCSNRILETTIGPTNYFLRINKYPFHILRNNPIASGAGADRFSTGMQKAFGKPIGQAAQFRKGQTIIEIKVDEKNIQLAKKAAQRAYTKLPSSCNVIIKPLKQ